MPLLPAADQDSECASIRSAAKIPIGKIVSAVSLIQIKLAQIYYIRSRES